MPHLKEEQQRAIYRMLAVQVQTYQEFQDHSTDKEKGLAALIESIIKTYELLLKNCRMGSLIITFNCQSIESLQHLWRDYLSGHLDEMAEQYLVTDEIKEKLNLETISLKTTIKYENYLNCRKVLLERPRPLPPRQYTQMESDRLFGVDDPSSGSRVVVVAEVK